jgi:hypothetical protein
MTAQVSTKAAGEVDVRYLTVVCALLAVVTCTLSTSLWRQLRAERAMAADLNARLAAVERRIPAPMMTPRPSGHAPTEVTQPASAELPVSPAPDIPAPSIKREVSQEGRSRKSLVAQLRDSLPTFYPGVIQALGLSPEQAERFWNLLAESQVESSEVEASSVDGQAAPMEVLLARSRLKEQADRKLDDALAPLLGESGIRQWQDYREHLPNRQEGASLERSMEAAGLPLSNAQLRQLNAAMDAEQDRQRGALTVHVIGSGAAARPDFAQMQQDRARLKAERNSHIIETMTPHLNGPQLDALRAALAGGLGL